MRRPVILLWLALCACKGGERDPGAVAGPPTTESSPPYQQWALEPTPVAHIGAVDGPPQLQLSRVVYAARLSDGRFVVVDGASPELRWFAPDGTYQSRAGGRGEGPGEFLSVGSATVTPDDAIVLYDTRNQRLTWFGADGSLARTLRVDLLGTVGLLPLADSRLIIADERPVFNFGGAEFNQTRDSLLIMRAPGASQPLDTLMRRVGREAATWVAYKDGKPIATRQFGLPFGHVTLVGAASGEVVLVDSIQAELTFFDEGGEIARLARRSDVNPVSVSPSLREEYVANAIRTARADGRPELPAKTAAKDLLAMVPDGQRVSPYDRLLVDAVAGRIWLREYLFDWDAAGPQQWTILDWTGQVLAQITTPPGLDVMHVGPTHLVGVERDELGVEYVVAYAFK